MFGFRDINIRERLLREIRLSLVKTNEICHTAESLLMQLKIVEDSPGGIVNVLGSGRSRVSPREW